MVEYIWVQSSKIMNMKGLSFPKFFPTSSFLNKYAWEKIGYLFPKAIIQGRANGKCNQNTLLQIKVEYLGHTKLILNIVNETSPPITNVWAQMSPINSTCEQHPLNHLDLLSMFKPPIHLK